MDRDPTAPYTGDAIGTLASYRVVKTVVKPPHWNNDRLTHEAEVMRNLDHPHILRIFGWAQDCSSIFMIMESCDGGELLGAVKKARYKFNDMPEVWASTVMRQILEAMAYCHAKGVVHKDLKSGNILLLNRATPETLFVQPPHGVVADLGLCEICGSTDWCGRGWGCAVTVLLITFLVWGRECRSALLTICRHFNMSRHGCRSSV